MEHFLSGASDPKVKRLIWEPVFRSASKIQRWREAAILGFRRPDPKGEYGSCCHPCELWKGFCCETPQNDSKSVSCLHNAKTGGWCNPADLGRKWPENSSGIGAWNPIQRCGDGCPFSAVQLSGLCCRPMGWFVGPAPNIVITTGLEWLWSVLFVSLDLWQLGSYSFPLTAFALELIFVRILWMPVPSENTGGCGTYRGGGL